MEYISPAPSSATGRYMKLVYAMTAGIRQGADKDKRDVRAAGAGFGMFYGKIASALGSEVQVGPP